uniref:Peptidase S9 prolyl oligopeptidase catalytic domain-containing protein n=2 Tax=Lotharella oceanica TaxID=641309 RepID=A0A7S2TSE5_9EUKA
MTDVFVEETGTNRSTLIHVPEDIDFISVSRVPAMIAFPGWHSNPWYFDRLTGLSQTGSKYGMVTAFGFGRPPASEESPICCPKGCDLVCCTKGDKLDLLRPCAWHTEDSEDVAYAKAIAAMLQRDTCVDPGRVFATGLSNGGSMAALVACKASDVFAGVAQMSGALPQVKCVRDKPIAFMAFCGLDDKSCTPTSNQTVKQFAAMNKCTEPFRPTFESATTKCRAARGCEGGVFVEQCFIQGLGDEVPGHDRVKPLYPGEPKQAPTNIDAIAYAHNRLSIISRDKGSG